MAELLPTDLDLALEALAAGRINSPMSLRETGAAAKVEIEQLRTRVRSAESAMVMGMNLNSSDFQRYAAAYPDPIPSPVDVGGKP